jgi:cell division protein ZapA|tara:strand:- start:44 stop:346 length:303 start_codon:yes stop_codon:yes gene_type:complete
MAKSTTSVVILGSEYKIACPPEESEAVKKAALYLDEKLKEIKEASNLDTNKVAIITALNITNEYLKDSLNKQKINLDANEVVKLTSEVRDHIKSISLLED